MGDTERDHLAAQNAELREALRVLLDWHRLPMPAFEKKYGVLWTSVEWEYSDDVICTETHWLLTGESDGE